MLEVIQPYCYCGRKFDVFSALRVEVAGYSKTVVNVCVSALVRTQ
jgi:hypothetical protein